MNKFTAEDFEAIAKLYADDPERSGFVAAFIQAAEQAREIEKLRKDAKGETIVNAQLSAQDAPSVFDLQRFKEAIAALEIAACAHMFSSNPATLDNLQCIRDELMGYGQQFAAATTDQLSEEREA